MLVNYIGKGAIHLDNSVQKWDKAADGFQKSFESGGNDYSERLMDFITGSCGVRAGSRVLDIGCGVGKYGVYLSRLGADVTLTDISPRMLEHARRNLEAVGGKYRTLCGDWCSFDLECPELSHGFDLSMATMSPAISDLDSVRRMSSVTRGICLVTNFLSWEDLSARRYFAALGREYDAQNDKLRLDCEALSDCVLKAGFEPRFRYEPYCWEDMRTAEDSAARFIERSLGGSADDKTRELILAAAKDSVNENGLVCDRVNTEVVWMYWDTREAKR